MDRGACSLIGLDKAIFDQQLPRYERCLLVPGLAAVTAAGWVETAQAGGRVRQSSSSRPGCGLPGGTDGQASQVRVQISARRMEGELARPEGDSVWHGDGQDQDLVKTWSLARVCESPAACNDCASEVQAGTRFRFEGGRQLSGM